MPDRKTDKLLALIAQGDNAAFEELYDHTRSGVYAFLFSYLHNHADTEDAMQTVYLKVKMHIASYDQGTNGRAWLLEIAKNHALNMIKARRSEPLERAENIPSYDAECDEGITAVMRRVLTEDEFRIVTLHVLWKYKHREIAQMFDCPTGTITSKYKRAIAKLQKEIKEEEL